MSAELWLPWLALLWPLWMRRSLLLLLAWRRLSDGRSEADRAVLGLLLLNGLNLVLVALLTRLLRPVRPLGAGRRSLVPQQLAPGRCGSESRSGRSPASAS